MDSFFVELNCQIPPISLYSLINLGGKSCINSNTIGRRRDGIIHIVLQSALRYSTYNSPSKTHVTFIFSKNSS